ncbi:carbohydrate ABC transporter permease [Alicyclobacillus dauci]|uniref:Carbohydrate ABC transporter permease n=1 Tax=Alicyclobacillus dauci TaxID=1475485 RepID=A0ABY6YYN0_9BACL|nr:carbohydrate ABC transporter permease [Alicyclobacillus dauci]WAH35189.1 carbohydrate ABC transporter permease [Alicyclobacillus dauci]
MIILIIALFPVFWMLISSFKNDVDIQTLPPKIIFTPTTNNYIDIFKNYPFLQDTLNSVYISFGSTILGLILGVPAAYAASKFLMKKYAFLTFIARMAPGNLFLIPWFIIASRWGMTNHVFTIILTHTVITLPVIIWLMISFFDDVSNEVEEAARVDGASRWAVLLKVSLPMAMPGIAVSSVLAFVFSWNYFLFALVLAGFNTTPLTVLAFNFIGEASVDWGGLMAAATLISLPALILVMFIQRWLVRGLTAGAVKG